MIENESEMEMVIVSEFFAVTEHFVDGRGFRHVISPALLWICAAFEAISHWASRLYVVVIAVSSKSVG